MQTQGRRCAVTEVELDRSLVDLHGHLSPRFPSADHRYRFQTVPDMCSSGDYDQTQRRTLGWDEWVLALLCK